jgi:aspartate kinase
LASIERVRGVAERIQQNYAMGRPTVVVVSAMGDTTDELLAQAGTVNAAGPARELDQLLATGENASSAMLALALHDLGVPAVSLTGPQAGILAAGPHGSGVIAAIDPARIRKHLDRGEIVVVAGFQGGTEDNDVITLGRGGSDTTAVALAAELQASCEIFTDVAGVYTADPRIVSTARLLRLVDSSVMTEMAFSGARVMHSRAVELAAVKELDIHVRSSFTPASGTTIVGRSGNIVIETRGFVVAVTHDLDVATVLIRFTGNDRNIAATMLRALARESVPVDLVTWSAMSDGESRMGFALRRSQLREVRRMLRETLSGPDFQVEIKEDVGKLSLVGTGLLNRPEHTARLLAALADTGISASWISTTQSRTSVIIPLDRILEAVGTLHGEFNLDRDDFDIESMAAF